MRSVPPGVAPTGRVGGSAALTWIALLLAVRFVLLSFSLIGVHTSVLEGGSKSVVVADASRYHQIDRSVGAPYRSFDVEYPPVALGAVEAVGRGSVSSTVTILGILGFALDVIVVFLLVNGWGERVATIYLVLGTPLALFAYFRIDFLALALSVLTVDLLRRGKERGAGAALSLAVFTKIWPLAVAPLFVAGRRRRALVWFGAASLAILCGWLLLAGWRGPGEVVGLRGARGWQIESLVGAVLWTLGFQPRFQAGAWRVGAAAGGIKVALLVATLAFVLWVWVLAAHEDRGEKSVSDGLATLAAVGVVMVTAPVLSPQYASWLLPWAAMATAPVRDRLLFGLVLSVTTLTTLAWFLPLPAAGFKALILSRNASLVGAVAVAAQRLRSARKGSPSERAGSRSPGLAV